MTGRFLTQRESNQGGGGGGGDEGKSGGGFMESGGGHRWWRLQVQMEVAAEVNKASSGSDGSDWKSGSWGVVSLVATAMLKGGW